MYDVPAVAVSDLPNPLPEALAVLDVREPVEWQHGHIEDAVHIPLHDLPQRLADVPVAGQLLVVCKIGGRSAQAVAWLRQQGIEAVNLVDGMIGWQESGRPMVADGSGDPTVV